MLIMAIDHVRDALHKGHPEPTDLAVTTPFLFFTRFITHFCAPTFVFLSGISASLAGTRRTSPQLSLFLIKRGCWLLLAEIFIISFAITLDPHYDYLIFQVIWAIGGSMILLGLLIGLGAPTKLIGLIGAVILFGHNIFDVVQPGKISQSVAWQLLVSGNGWAGEIQLGGGRVINVPYALLPWTGVLFLGYAIGPLYSSAFDAGKRKKLLLYAGVAALVFFFIFRVFNIYGDPAPWAPQKTMALSIISFFNVTKYPCSLLYLSMTLGVALVILSRTENINTRLSSILSIYGSVPFFYYVCHWYLIQVIMITLFFATGHTTSQIVTHPVFFAPPDFGISLAGVYFVWLAVVLALYRPCKWFSNYKKTHRYWWLSYV